MSAAAIKERLFEQLELQVKGRPGGNVGAVVAIYSKGKEEFLFLGEVTRGSKKVPGQETIFEIGSLTQIMTGLFFSHAVQNGRMKESDRLDSMMPEWKRRKTSDIILGELANHTSGLPELPCNMKDLPYAPYDYTEKDLVEGLMDSPAMGSRDCQIDESNPTATARYSSWGYGLLAYLITFKTGSTFQELVRGLGLPQTTVTLNEAQRGLMAQGYATDGREVSLHDVKALYGSSSVKSSARDMLNFGKRFLLGEVNHKTTPHGWIHTKEGNLFQEGKTFGFASYIGVYPDQDLVVLYLTNTARYLECFWQTVEKRACQVEVLRGRALWL